MLASCQILSRVQAEKKGNSWLQDRTVLPTSGKTRLILSDTVMCIVLLSPKRTNQKLEGFSIPSFLLWIGSSEILFKRYVLHILNMPKND